MRQISPPPAPATDDVDTPRLVLRDGTVATIRHAECGDADAVRRFFHDLSPESRHKRFFAVGEPPERLIESLCDSTTPSRGLTLLVDAPRRRRHAADCDRVVHRADRGRRRGGVRRGRSLPGQGARHGAARAARRARRRGRFQALPGDDARRQHRDARGLPRLRVRDPIEVGGRLHRRAALARRRRSRASPPPKNGAGIATAASLTPMLEPRAVAVVGASRDETSIGRRVVDALVAGRLHRPHLSDQPARERDRRPAGVPDGARRAGGRGPRRDRRPARRACSPRWTTARRPA